MTQVGITRRIAVEAADGVDDGWSYADAFEISLSAPDSRSAEQWARAGLEGLPALRPLIRLIHRRVLGFRLRPVDSPGSILGWPIESNDREAIRLTADGPLMRGVLVGRRSAPDCTELHTFLFYKRRGAATIWRIVGPIHRAVAPYLLRKAAEAKGTTGELPAEAGLLTDLSKMITTDPRH